MTEKDIKQIRATREFEKYMPEILRLFSDAPAFGSTSITIHFMEGKIKRLVHYREESFIPKQ